MPRPFIANLIAVLLAMLVAEARAGDVMRVANDAALRAAIDAAKPGVVIRIAPGTYRGGLSATIRGTKDQPITIEAEDAKSIPVIEGGSSGLHLSAARHVVLRNLKIRKATGNGLNIDDGGTMDQSAVGIVIENLIVEEIGPKGNCDGIKLSGVRDFVVRGCRIEGWGGNAIDLVGCAEGVIEKCIVRGRKGFSAATGPQLKGGTRNVIVRGCLFDHAGERAINAGGSTDEKFFRPLDAKYEAKNLTIEENVFIGSEAAVAFVGVDGAIFRRNTIVEPGKWVMRILQESRGERFVRCGDVIVERNLIAYSRERVKTIVNVGDETRAESFAFRENWWWCLDAPGSRPSLPVKETGGVYGRDPKIQTLEGGWMVPRAEGARDFGAGARSSQP